MTDQTLSFLSPFAGGTSVGVAIEVPPPYTSALRQLREDVGDAAGVEIIPPHITLVPPTVLPSFDLTGVEAQLAKAAAATAAFTVELAGPGSFRPLSQVVYAALTQGEQECDALQQAVRQGPLAQELRFDYHPHVTVAQDVPPENREAAEQALTGFRARFTVDSFALYELAPDNRWHTIRTFSLTGRP